MMPGPRKVAKLPGRTGCSAMSIFWAQGPPRPHAKPGPEMWATPPDGLPYYVRILAEPTAVWLHWLPLAKRTAPCTAPDCPHCPAVRQQWKGYAPALLFEAVEGKKTWWST